jgi:hypothetical protein
MRARRHERGFELDQPRAPDRGLHDVVGPIVGRVVQRGAAGPSMPSTAGSSQPRGGEFGRKLLRAVEVAGREPVRVIVVVPVSISSTSSPSAASLVIRPSPASSSSAAKRLMAATTTSRPARSTCADTGSTNRTR